MMKTRKIIAAIMTAAILFALTVCIGAVGNGELSISAKSAGANELEIKLTNTSNYYLGNVNIKVSSADGSKTKITSYGISGTSKNGVDTIRSVAPGGTVSLFAKYDGGKANAGSTKPVTPVESSKVPGDPVVKDPVATEIVGTENAVTEGSVTVTETAIDSEKTDGTKESGTTVGTVHSIAPGESTTLIADISETNGGDSDDKNEDGGNGALIAWIIAGVVAVVAVGAVVFVVITDKKKKKNITKDISAVIALALILGALVSVRGDAFIVSAADAITAPTPGSSSLTFAFSDGSGTVTVSADYTVAPAPIVQTLKNNRRAPAMDECNNQNTPMSSIVEGAGPLGGLGIYVGKNDFMFFGDALKDYRGQTIMQDGRLKKLASSMNERDAWAKENGIKLYLVIAPNKTTVYGDYVPEKVKAGAMTNADKVVEYLAANSTVEVIDLRGALKNARATYGDTLFYKYDTHWNNNGGFVGYTEMMRRINEDVPGAYTLTKNDFDISTQETYMKDMAWYLGHYSAYQDFGPVYTLKSGMTATIKNKGEYDWHGQFRYSSKWTDGYSDSLKYVTYENAFNTSAPSVYMYRDSFSVAMLHFIKDSFHKSTFDWSYEFNKAEILQSGADVVIMEVVEKQLTEFTNTRTFSN